jgi:hypothetical protein
VSSPISSNAVSRVSHSGLLVERAVVDSNPEAVDALRLLVEGRPFGRIVLTYDFAYKKNPTKTRG